MATLSDQIIITRQLVHPEPPTHKVTGVIDLPDWQPGVTHIIRMFAEDGEHITLPWFALLAVPGADEPPGLVRRALAITNNRFLFRPARDPQPGHGLGKWGWSWYFNNTSDVVSGPVRLEVGFVATLMHPPHDH